MRCHSILLLVVVFVSFIALDDAFGQRKKKSRGPLIGDIVEYDDFHEGPSFGLIIEINRAHMKVEHATRNGDFKTSMIHGNMEWKVILSVKKQNESKLRTWKSKDGKSRIEATFEGLEDDKVRLKKENGKIISVPLGKLSDKDQQHIEKLDEPSSGDLFDVEEEEDFPAEVYTLIERRDALMKRQQRHQFLARQGRLGVGDIVVFEDFHRGMTYGIVYSLDFGGKVETVDEDGNLKKSHGTLHDRWWFYDRQNAPVISRTWKSSNGKFKIAARLIDIEEGDKLVLEKDDGDTVRVPLSKLGSADQTYVKRNRAKLKAVNNSPLTESREEYDEELQMLLARRTDLVKRVVAGTVAAKDAAKMKSVSLNTRKLQLSREQLQPITFEGEPFSVVFSEEIPRHARIENVAYSAQSGLVAFAAASPFYGSPRLIIVDSNTSDILINDNSQRLGDDASVLAISPSGKMILIHSQQDFHNRQLELWSHENGELKRISMVPYDSFREPIAHLFSDETGAILNREGDLVFFDVADRIKPTHIVQSGTFMGGNQIQLSNDRKSVFYFGTGGSSLHVVDIATRRCVGGLVFGNPNANRFEAVARVNPDGKTATHIRDSVLSQVNLKTGDLVGQFELPKSIGASSFSASSRSGDGAFPMLGKNLIKTFHNGIYDVELDVEIGKIGGGGFGARYFSGSQRIVAKVDHSMRGGRGGFGSMMGAGRTQPMRDREEMVSTSIRVSFENLDVEEIKSFAASLSDEDIIEFGEGDSVSLDIDLGSDRLDSDLESTIIDIMEEGGIKVRRRADFKLVVRYTEGKPKTETFKIIGDIKPRSRTVTVKPKSCSAKLMLGDEVVWSQAQSVSLGRPFSEDDLNNILARARKLNANAAFDFKYPTERRVLSPSKKRTFEWR